MLANVRAIGEQLTGKKKMLTAREAYRLGYEAVCNQARQVGALYEQLLPHFQSYGLVCLQDTVIKGIPAFLMHYDARYCPQDTLLTLDYPVLTDFGHLCGVQAVWAYLRCIALEQRFLSRLDFEFVCDSLRDYHVDYTVLIENICGIVLPWPARPCTIGKTTVQAMLYRAGLWDTDQPLRRYGATAIGGAGAFCHQPFGRTGCGSGAISLASGGRLDYAVGSSYGYGYIMASLLCPIVKRMLVFVQPLFILWRLW